MQAPTKDTRVWTEGEVRALIEEAPGPAPRCELVDGELLVTSAPNTFHQRVVFELAKLLDTYVRAHALGETRIGPSDTHLGPGLVLQPDVYVVPSVDGRRPRGTERTRELLLAVEVISPSSARFDRFVKRRAYQRVRVPEYWVVDPDARAIERWRPGDERPEPVADALLWTPTDGAPPLAIDLVALFAEVFDEA